ncbi:MAG: serine--glyoxylate aminotransferase [Gemmataceae bacterium]
MNKYRLLTPGPVPVPEETLLELARPVVHHRTAESRRVLADVLAGMRYVYQTAGDVVPLTCSGTGAMEAALVNAVPRGRKALCLVAGRFGERWHKLWTAFGVESIPLKAPDGRAVSVEQVREALARHPDVAAVCVVYCETSTGVKHDVRALGELVAQTPAVLIVDAISALGTMECRTDDWHLDLVACGSQKALMLPPGLAFLSVSRKAWEQIEKHSPPAYYFDLRKYRAKLAEPDTPYTPAHTLLRALVKNLHRIQSIGIENFWEHHGRLARAARAGVQALGLKLFADPPADGLTVASVPDQLDGQELLRRLEKDHGIKLAGGQDQLRGKIVRLAHMGYMDFFDILAALAGLEMTLLSMGWRVELGASLTAAQHAYAQLSATSRSRPG